jgi:hypothetical protein
MTMQQTNMRTNNNFKDVKETVFEKSPTQSRVKFPSVRTITTFQRKEPFPFRERPLRCKLGFHVIVHIHSWYISDATLLY